MHGTKRFFVSALFLVCSVAQALGDQVFVLPSSQTDTLLPVFADEPFQRVVTLSGGQGPVGAFRKPDGTRVFVVSRSSSDTILVYDSTLAVVLERIGLGQAAQAAALSPDGTRLVVLAGNLRVFDITSDPLSEVGPSPAPDVGVNPIDVAISQDSRRAFILSDDSNRLSVYDMVYNHLTGSGLAIPGNSTSVSVAPNGTVYVAGTSVLYEIDPATGQSRGEISVVSPMPGKAAFTPDGKYAVIPNLLTATGVAVLVDLTSRSTVATLPPGDSVLEQLTPIDDNRMLAVATNSRELVQITISPFEMRTGGFLFAGRQGVRAVAATREIPMARYVFVATSDTLSRGVVATSATQDAGLAAPPGRLALAGSANMAAAYGYRKFNDEQSLLAGGTTLPLTVRVWDAGGLPVFNKSVQFTTQATGATIETPATTTNLNGYASTRVTVPSTAGAFEVTATVDGMGGTISFLVTVLGGGGPGRHRAHRYEKRVYPGGGPLV